ncbi:hypothetical protein [Endozoicomonas lisbonensis]|uniref:Chromosome segregation ATPase n=1 Tax=Endozoicomonas lisbonensis TaxID=3120522 RepID=A0ABV2SD59_9GAMM
MDFPPPRSDGTQHSTGARHPVHVDWGDDKRPNVRPVEPARYLPKPAHSRSSSMEGSLLDMSERSVEALKSVTPVLSPPLTPPDKHYGNPALKLSAPFSRSSGAESTVMGVTEYEVQRASAANLEQMQARVIRLHQALNFPLPPPLENLDVRSLTTESLTRETIPLGSVQLTVARAKVMREVIEQRETAKNEQLERNKTDDGFYRAIILSAELEELREDLEAVTEYYCRRSYIPEGYIPCKAPFVIPGSPENETDSGYFSGEEVFEAPVEGKLFAAPQPQYAGFTEGKEVQRGKLMPGEQYPDSGVQPGQPSTSPLLSHEDELQEQLEESQQAIEQLKAEVEQLNSHLEEAQSHAEHNEQTIQFLNQELESKTQLLSDREAGLETLKDQWERLKTSNDQLTDENASLLEQQQHQQALIEKLQLGEARMRNALAETQAAKGKLEETIGGLEREIASQKDQVLQKSSALEQEQQRSRQAAAEAATRFQEVHDLLEESARSNDELKSQLEQLTLAESHLKDQLAEMEQQLEQAKSASEAQLLAAAEEFEAKHQKTKDELRKAEENLKTLRKNSDQAVEELVDALAEVHSKLETKNQQISALTKAAEASKTLEASLNTQLEELNSTLQSVEKDKTSLESKIEELEQSVAEKEQQLSLQQSEAAKASKQALDEQRQLTEELESTKQLSDKLRNQIEAKNEQISALTEAAEASKTLEASLNTQLEELNSTLQSVEKDKTSLESKIEELEQSVAEKEQQLSLQQSEAAKASKQALDEQRQLTEELESTKQLSDKLRNQIEAKNEQISALTEAAEASKTQEASLNTQLEELNSTLQSVEKDKTSLESKIEELEQSVAEKEQQLSLQQSEAENVLKRTLDEQQQLTEELESTKQLSDELNNQLKAYKEIEATLKAEASQAKEALAERERQESIEVQHLKSELEKNQEKLNREQLEVIRLRAARQAIANAQQQTDEDIEAVQAESKRLIEEANEKITSLEQQLSEKNNKIEDWKRQFDEAVAEHESQLNAYRDQITSLQSLTSETEQKNNLSETENKLLQRQLSDLQAGEALLKDQLSEWQTKHQELEKQHNLLNAAELENQSALASSQEAQADAETRASARENELQKLKSDYQQLIDDSETKQKQHDQVLSEALEGSQLLAQKLKDSEEETAGWKAKAEQSQEALNQKLSEIETASKQRETAEEKARALQDQVTSSQQTISELQEALNTVRGEAEKAGQQLSSQAEADQKAQTELAGLKDKETRLERELDELRSKETQYLQQLTDAEKAQTTISDEVKSLEQALKEQQEQHSVVISQKESEFDQQRLNLEKELAVKDKALTESESHRHAVEEEKQATESKLNNLVEEQKVWNQQRSEFEAQIRALQDKLRSQEETSGKERLAFVAEQEKLQGQLQTETERLTDQQTAFEKLQSQLEESQALLSDTQKAHQEAQGRADDFQTKLEEEQARNQQALSREQTLSDELERLQTARAELEQKKSEVEQKRDECLTELGDKTEQIQKLEVQLRERELEIATLNDGDEGVKVLSEKVTRLQEDVKTITADRDLQADAVKDTLQQKQKAELELEQLRVQGNELELKNQHAIREAEEQLKQREQRVNTLDEALNKLTLEKAKADSLIKSAESDLQSVNHELEQQRILNTQLKGQAEGFRSEKEDQLKEVGKLKLAQSELTSEKLSLERRISDLTEKSEALAALQIDYQDVKNQLNESNKKLIEEETGFGNEKRRWDSERSLLNKELSDLKNKSATAEKRIEFLSTQIDESKKDHKALKQAHTQAVDDLDKLRPENERLKNEEERLRGELDNLQKKSSEDYGTLQKAHAQVSTELTNRTNDLERKTQVVERLEEDLKGSSNKVALLESRLEKELSAALQRAETAEARILSTGDDLTAKQQDLALVREEKSIVESQLQAAREQAESLQQQLNEKQEQLGHEHTELSETLIKLKNTEARVKSLEDSHHKLEEQERQTSEQLGVTEVKIGELEKQVALEKELAETARLDRDEAFQKRDEAINEQQALLRFSHLKKPLVQESDSDDFSSTDSGYSLDSGSMGDAVEPLGIKQLVQELKSFKVNDSGYVIPEGDEDQIGVALSRAAAALEEEIEKIEKNSKVYQYKPDEPPSQSEKRKQIIQALKVCHDKVQSVRDKYKTDEQESGSRKAVQKYLARIDVNTAVFEAEQKSFESGKARIREHSFDEKTRPFESLVQTNSDNPHDLVTRVLVKLRHLQQHSSRSPIQGELDGYTAAFLATSACSTLQRQFQEKVKTLEGQGDSALKSLLAYKEALQRILPGRLPLELANAVSPNARHYMEKQIAGAVAAIENAAEGDRTESTADFASTDSEDPRGESGKRQALSLLDNPVFARDVLSFLTSVRKEHQGIDKPWYNYTAASSAWLRDMRQKHGLIDMPTFSELYEACLFDLESRNASRLVTAKVTSNEGDFSSNKQGTKRQKLINQVKGCQDEEKKLEGTAEAFRGQSHNDSQLVVHPHRQVLDCFKKGTGQKLLDSTAVSRVSGSYRITDLGQNTNALFNTFFDGAGTASVKQSIVTGTRYMQLQSNKCIPPLVFEEKRDKGQLAQWKVAMGGAVWTVDPTLLLDHPELEVPFENRSGKPSVQRDWIPVRDDQGNTGILLLQKTRSNPQYFLYEVDTSGQLVPRTISDKPVEELQQARFLSKVVSLKPNNESNSVGKKQLLVQAILGSRRKWLPVNCEAQAHQLYLDSAVDHPVKAPIDTVDASDDLQFYTVSLNPLRNIIKTKREEQHKSATTLAEYNPEHYASFNVDATFNVAGDAFINTCQEHLKHDSDPVLGEQAAEQARFRKEVFKPLYVFEGCELKPQYIPASMDGEPPEGSPAFVSRRLDRVMTVNREHCTRLVEQMAVLRQQIVQQVASADQEKFSRYSERQILNQVMADFERGRLPAHCKDGEFINLVANLMLAENDLAQTQKIISRQESIKRDLQQLAADAPMMIDEKGGDRAAYANRCRKINLSMADCATAQENIHRSLENYADAPLTTDRLAKLSFERRARTVLRENQIEEVNAALQQLTECMADDASDKSMSRVSHKGTGWGKSTILKILTAHAAELAEGQKDCSVVVCAPVTNQAELDIDLSRFYAAKGKVYRRLDLEKDFVKPGQAWWTEEAVRKIENIVLGVAPEVPENQRQAVLQQEGQAPVGISVKDVQILKHLLNALESKGDLQPSEKRVVDRLHSIFGILAKSPTFIDEWVSLVVPYRTGDPQNVLDATRRAISALPDYQPTMDDIIRSHDEYVMSCSRRHLLCATPGTNYAQAVVAKADRAEDIKELAHTDPFTTQQRFNFWMSKAEPIFVTDPATANRPELLRQVVNKVGTDRSVLVFDGTESGDKTVEKAKAFYQDLKNARKEYAPTQAQKVRGMVFYNKQKEMQQYLEDDPRYGQESGATVLPEEEALMRQEGGTGIDVYFTQEQSEGTDAPQKGPDGEDEGSVGVCLGVVEQGKEGRADAVAQQLGRLMRRSTPRNLQKLFVVVDMKAVADICSDSPQKKKLQALSSELETAKAKINEHAGANQENLSSTQRKLVNQPLEVEDDIKAEKQIRKTHKDKPGLIKSALDARLENQMQEQLQHLKTVEWSQSGILGEFAEDLAHLKKLEWKAKKAWVELAFVEMAKREQNEDTRHYETLLEQAQVRSHVSGQLEKEHQWLQQGCAGVCQNLTFSEGVNKKLGSELKQSMVLQSFRETTEALMQQSPRRVAKKQIDKSEVKDIVTPDFVKQQIERCANEISISGLEQVVTDPLKTVRRDLYEKAIQAREVLVQRVSELEAHILEADKSVATDKKASGSYIRNLKGLTKIREQAEKEITDFRSVLDKQSQPTDRLDDLAIELKTGMTKRHVQMMDALTNVSFTTHINQSLRDSILENIKDSCAKFVTNSSHKLSFYSTSLEIEKKKALAQQETRKKSQSKEKGIDATAVQTEFTGVHLIIWRKTSGSKVRVDASQNDYAFSNMLFGDSMAQGDKSPRARPSSRGGRPLKSANLTRQSKVKFFSTPDLRERPDPEKEVDKLINTARSLKQEQKEKEAIRDFCANPGSLVFKQCLDEWKEQALNEMNAFYRDRQEESEAKVDFMTRQANMMQQFTVKTQ